MGDGFIIQATIYAIKQTDRETGVHQYREFQDGDGPVYPALFTSKPKADAYARTLRRHFGEEVAFSVVTVRTMDLLSVGEEPPTLIHGAPAEKPLASPVVEGKLG